MKMNILVQIESAFRYSVKLISPICFNVIAGVVIILSVMGCEPEFEGGEYFIIRKGTHYTTSRKVETLQSPSLSFEARFDESAVYSIGEDPVQSNINKLLGFADCNSQHHENSARFGWRWFNKQLQIFAYCYVDGARVETFLGNVQLNTFNRYEIQLTTEAYIFILNGEAPVSVPRKSTCNTGVYYKLWPYFGGSVPAPQDIRIEIKHHY